MLFDRMKRNYAQALLSRILHDRTYKYIFIFLHISTSWAKIPKKIKHQAMSGEEEERKSVLIMAF